MPLLKFPAGSTSVDPVVLVDSSTKQELPPISYSVQPTYIDDQRIYRVQVTETHVKQGDDRPVTMDRVKVSMEIPPSRILRRYISGGKEIVHTFEYPERANLDIEKLKEFNVILTAVDAIKANSVHTHESEEKAMLVNIPTGR